MTRSAQRGFTLVEVMVASFVLALLATGAIATAWRLSAFARDESEKLAADMICRDVWYEYMTLYLCGATTLPTVEEQRTLVMDEKAGGTDRTRRMPYVYDEVERTKVYPLQRRADYPDPVCYITPTNASSGKGIVVRVEWGLKGSDNKRRSYTLPYEPIQ